MLGRDAQLIPHMRRSRQSVGDLRNAVNLGLATTDPFKVIRPSMEDDLDVVSVRD